MTSAPKRTVWIIAVLTTLAVWLVGGGVRQGYAVPITITKVVDTNTVLPEANEPLRGVNMRSGAAISGSEVVFGVRGAAGYQGIYVRDMTTGAIRTVANNTETVASADGDTFSAFDRVAIDRGNVVFQTRIRDSSGLLQDALYLSEPTGNRSIVVNDSTPIPDGTLNFSALVAPWAFTPDLEGNRLVFPGGNQDDPQNIERGLYLAKLETGEIQTVVDHNTTIPGTEGPFEIFWWSSFDGPWVTFHGLAPDRSSGVYVFDTDTGNLQVIADTNTQVPNGENMFAGRGGTSTWIPDVSGNTVAFTHYLEGVYLADIETGELSVVANTTTPLVGAGFEYADRFSGTAIEDELVVFIASAQRYQDQGIFISYGGAVEKVIDTTDLLEGKPILALSMGQIGGADVLDDSSFLFSVSFEDGSEGIYVAYVPKPSTLSLPLTGITGENTLCHSLGHHAHQACLANTRICGVRRAKLSRVLEEGKAMITADGELHVSGKGLRKEIDDAVGDFEQVVTSLCCRNIDPYSPKRGKEQVVRTSQPVTIDENGDFEITEANFLPPGVCENPSVLVRKWLPGLHPPARRALAVGGLGGAP